MQTLLSLSLSNLHICHLNRKSGLRHSRISSWKLKKSPKGDFFNEFTSKVYKPGYKNFATLVHAGNTDGWGKAVTTLCNPGEGVLTEEWTYPSAMAVCFFFCSR